MAVMNLLSFLHCLSIWVVLAADNVLDILQLIDEYQKNFGESWRTVQADNAQPWPYLNEALAKFQDPAEADKLLKIQRELDETKIILHKTIDSVLARVMLRCKVGRYGSPEEHPFFPDNLPSSVLPQYNHPRILYPTAAAININETIWDVYVNQLLPLFTTEGDDGNYVPTATSDLQCLQTCTPAGQYIP
ncbi:hypothetical protein POM88_027121 [Heracleum sosnowskyi]|uniref:chorismate mutase n=1 Tax=Heracleum sosnowskyi TaxID=360622 RepID=A0AAD8I732_9APIA|nr:hypothetical protein POM88_027121 [Heracleum sosnowskyi]